MRACKYGPKSLRARFLIVAGICFSATTLVVFLISFYQSRSSLLDELEKRGFALTQNLTLVTQEAIRNDDFSELEKSARSALSSPDAVCVIVQDGDGQLLTVASDSETDFTSVRRALVSTDWHPDTATSFTLRQPDGSNLYVFSAPAGDEPSGMVSKRPAVVRVGLTSARTLAALEGTFRIALVVWFVLTAAGLTGIAFVTRWALNPLKHMADVADAVAHGDLSQRVEVGCSDEIGTLGAAFNDMTESLFKSHEDLERRNQELEQLADEKHRSYQQLRQAQERLAQSENMRHSEKLRSVGQMASGVAHDFNNVLAAITGRVQLIQLGLERRNVKDPSLHDSLAIIERAALDGAETVRRIQEFSRERHKKDMQRADLNHLVREVIEITRPRWRTQAEQRGVRVEVETQFARIPQVACVPSEIREVLTNIIFNAVDAMPEGGTLKIKSSIHDRGVLLTISDSGTGMPEDVCRRVFEPFYTTKGTKGNGLGLSIVYGIIKHHKGDIKVSSHPDVGTTFTICLPPATGDLGHVADDTLMLNRSARILVADDESTVRQALAELLIQLGHEVTEAVDGRAVLDAFRPGAFDYVFTDLGMPDLSGWEVAAAIREQDTEIPIILVTGWGNQISTAEAELKGVTRVMAKPFTIQKVSSLIAEIQGLSKAA